jgi:predicted metal-dependent TIM-barrel fold hydrolase
MWFDAQLHARSLAPRALADLAFFGVGGALVPGGGHVVVTSGAAIRRDWAAVATAVRRLRRGGLAAYAALGIAPDRIPPRGLEALLADLPDLLGRGEVAAIGPVGLDAGGPWEERGLALQLELARELRMPVLVRTPPRARERGTRRLLVLLREAELDPRRVLVAPADARTVKLVRACGFAAGLWLSGARGALEDAVEAVAALGPEGIVLGSDAGEGGGDLLALPRAADRLAKAGLSDAVIRRACGGNAVLWLGVDAARRERARAR